MTFGKSALYGHFKEGVVLISEMYLQAHEHFILENKNNTRKPKWRSSEKKKKHKLEGSIWREMYLSPMVFMAGKKTGWKYNLCDKNEM